MSRKITAIVVDDELYAIQRLTRLAEGIENLEIMDTFTDPMKALKSLRANYVDLVFLDVEMEPIDGLQFLAQLSGKTKAVLVSGYDKYAINSYEYAVSDYLMKPVAFNRLATAVGRVRHQMGMDLEKGKDHPDGSFCFLIKGPTRFERTVIRFDDLMYLESISGRILFHVQHKEEPLVGKEPLNKVISVLPPARFMRIHRSFIINLGYFDRYHNGTAIMVKPDIVLPVGKRRSYPEFYKWMERHTPGNK